MPHSERCTVGAADDEVDHHIADRPAHRRFAGRDADDGRGTSDRRRTADVAFGAMMLAEMIDRAMSAADMDDDGGVVSGAVEAVGRALRVLASV